MRPGARCAEERAGERAEGGCSFEKRAAPRTAPGKGHAGEPTAGGVSAEERAAPRNAPRAGWGARRGRVPPRSALRRGARRRARQGE
eukprot:11469686-Karenia_brevis.AAC.1